MVIFYPTPCSPPYLGDTPKPSAGEKSPAPLDPYKVDIEFWLGDTPNIPAKDIRFFRRCLVNKGVPVIVKERAP
jgi:hypothetical protein